MCWLKCCPTFVFTATIVTSVPVTLDGLPFLFYHPFLHLCCVVGEMPTNCLANCQVLEMEKLRAGRPPLPHTHTHECSIFVAMGKALIPAGKRYPQACPGWGLHFSQSPMLCKEVQYIH